ncbi:embryonic polarity protein dorsal-like isoform X2 [Prorops nasuta]|uniref:embryonic polarity protein dorsal-like isoform X2 n=1 Tax=Prorops nasuta TaxID=863751 RepID=UPI0034CD0AB3
MDDGSINISDVIEVIQTDPGFSEVNQKLRQEAMEMSMERAHRPYVEIVEQPAGKALRFRYECEGRSAGSIPGVNSTPENRTYPSIKVVGYKGRAVAVVSCVTKDPPYRPHPHNLVGKEACKQGVCTLEFNSDNMICTFANLGIQCVKKKDIEDALKAREEMRVDPYRTGFEHKKQSNSIDLNALRLCFQVFVEGNQKGKFNVPLTPVVSNPIFDKKAMSDLVICKLSHCCASVAGGTEMILLCEKVAKEDIQVKFFEEQDGQVLWEGYGDFQPTHVHKQTAIAFRTPSYHQQQVEQPVQVFIQLRRPSDGTTSEALPFQMLPLGSDDPDTLRRKRQKFNNSPNALVLRHVQKEAEKRATFPPHLYNIQQPESVASSPYSSPVPSCSGYSPYQGGASSPQSQAGKYSLRPIASPRRRLSPKDSFSLSPMSQELSPQYLPPQLEPAAPFPFLKELQETKLVPLIKVQHEPVISNPTTPEPIGSSSVTSGNSPTPLVIKVDVDAGPSNIMDLDNQQDHFDLNQLDSAELAMFDTELSENLSSGLSLTDKTEFDGFVAGQVSVPAGNINNSNNFMGLSDNTAQDLSSLNDLLRSLQEGS